MLHVPYERRSPLESLRPFTDQIAAQSDTQVVGGITANMLMAPSLEISTEERVMTIYDRSDLGPMALPTQAGQREDVDVLVLSTGFRRVQEVDHLVKAALGHRLRHSVNGLRSMDELDWKIAHPKKSLVTAWQPAIYAEADYDEITQVKQAVYPIVVNLEPEALQTWQLHIPNENPIPVPHPGMTILYGLTRRLTGLDRADRPRLDKLATNVFSKAPEVREWIHDGLGAGGLVFARILHGLGGASELSFERGLQAITNPKAESSENPQAAAAIPEVTIDDPDYWLGSALKAHKLIITPIGLLQARRRPEFPINDDESAWRALNVIRNKARLLRLLTGAGS